MELFERISAFVIENRWEPNFKITRETTLAYDLKLWGDDAYEFIEAFGVAFNVDISEFNFDKHFPTESGALFQLIIDLFGIKEKRYLHMTIGVLEAAAKTGKLV